MNIEFRQRQSTTLITIGIGVLLLVVGFLSFTATGQNGSMMGLGIMGLSIGLWNRSRVMIALRDDHMEMKAAPISARHMILYSDMTGLHELDGKASLETAHGSFKLPLHLMEDGDKYTLLSELGKRIKK
jgi:hypothetical protein